MRLAKQININTAQGGYTIVLGKMEPWKDDSPEIERIEVTTQEYPDHSEVFINVVSDGKVIRSLWNCPVDIIYADERAALADEAGGKGE